MVKLCTRFHIPSRPCIQGFRNFKDCGGKRSDALLLPLNKAISSLVVSTADCERGFSQMGLIMCSTRTALGISRLSKLLFLKCVGPPLSKFNPSPYVNSWLLKGHVTADDNKARSCDKQDQNLQEQKYEGLWNVL